jgi:hypothetical protein
MSAVRSCQRGGNNNCTGAISVCDGTAGSKVINPDGTTEGSDVPFPRSIEPVQWDFSFLKFIPGLQILLASKYFAGLILMGLLLWIIFSAVSTTPSQVLKGRTLITAWIGVPAALAFASMLTLPKFFNGLSLTQVNMTFVWTEVFAALAIGNALRRRFLTNSPSPALLSMPLIVLVFSLITVVTVYEVVDLATFPRPSDCNSLFHATSSLCTYADYQGFVIFGAALIVLILCGLAIPANSNLILANDWVLPALKRLRARVKTYFVEREARIQREVDEREARWKEEAEKEKERAEQEATGSFPVPAVVEGAAPIDKMRLKLRRAQRSTAIMGNPVFTLDARIELTAEEQGLVAKYRLGNIIVYESATRKQHRAAMSMHAEQTRDDMPGWTASAGSQLLGSGKMLYRFARAGMSATAAAMALKVTIYSLIQGVHVECKSLDELIEAENAIVEAAQNLKGYLHTAVSFDGREEIIEL